LSGALAICNRDLRKFVRQPAMLVITIMVPFLMLVLIGYAFGGAIAHVPIAVVQDSFGTSSNNFLDILRTEQSCQFGGVNCQNSFQLVNVADLGAAQTMLRESLVKAVVYIPADFGSHGAHDVVAYLDTTDPLSAGTISAELTQATQRFSVQLQSSASEDPQANLVLSSPYPNISYIEFMAPSSAMLAIAYASAIGGGITLLEDRERGVIEGYLVTPLKRYEIVFGVLLSGVIKAVLSAGGMLVVAILVAGVHPNIDLTGAVLIVFTLFLTSLGIISMVTVMGVRAPNRAMLQFLIAPLVLILFFTSGGIYPVQGFPSWMRVIATVNPEAYAFHALRLLMYKGATWAGVIGDFTFLAAFTMIMLALSTLAFSRSL
jgi:ABC-2 type transport system permease protein